MAIDIKIINTAINRKTTGMFGISISNYGFVVNFIILPSSISFSFKLPDELFPTTEVAVGTLFKDPTIEWLHHIYQKSETS